MKKLRILHLSDTHFGQRDEDGEQERILDAVVEAVAKDGLKADLIVFTGDLAFSGSPTQFEQGQIWLQKIQAITGGRIAVCPGNHDADRTKADVDEIRTAYANEEAFSINGRKIYKHHPHLKDFIDWYKNAFEASESFIPLWKDNPYLTYDTLEINNIPVRIVALNTAALSCKNDDEGKLCMDVSALNSALKGSAPEEELIICIGHHPIKGWMAPWNAQKIINLIEQEVGPHLYFHGHLHEQDSKAFYSAEGQGVGYLSSGATYQGSKWAQFFTIIELDFNDNQLVPNTYSYHSKSGRWLNDATKSRPIPLKLPKLSNGIKEENKCENNKANNGEDESAPSTKWINPFDNVVSNSLEAHIIPELFVDENNFLNRISKPFDSLLEGQRGTGKTMLLRYLSVEVQASILSKKSMPTMEAFRKGKINLGVYSRFSNAGFNRSDYEVVESPDRRQALFYHRVTLFVLSDLIASCAHIAVGESNEIEICKKISGTLARALREDEIKGIDNWNELSDLTSEVCNDLISRIDEHLGSLLPGGTKTEFNPWLTPFTTLKQVLEKLHGLLDLKSPFFLLMDDFDTLNSEQQGWIFKVARERNHSIVCFKYGIMTLGQKNTMAGEGITYREGDDYDHIILQWHEKGLSGSSGAAGNYKQTVIKIADKRFEAFGWPKPVRFKTLYRTWAQGNNIRNEVKVLAKTEYDELPVKNRPKDFNSFWSKQGDAYFFRHLRANKIRHRYAGPDVIVDLSSGIFRQFLEVNSRIVAAALDKGWGPDKGRKLGPEIQDDLIRFYAKEMLKSLGETSGDTSALSQCEFDITSSHLINLSKSLIALFSDRLYSDSRDAEIIAISVKGDLQTPSFAKAMLDIAVRESVLQRRSLDYSSKSVSEGRLPTYYLNRRLAPEGNLGLKMQGRIELTIDAIELAAKDTNLFISSYGYKSKARIKKTSPVDVSQGDFFDK